LTWFLDTLKIIVGRRWPLIAILFAVEIVVVVYITSLPFFPSELNTYETQYKSIAPVLKASPAGQVSAIFANNFRVATIELIPALGLAVFGLSLYETARIVEVIGLIEGVGAGFALANLFFLPSTWLELPAYAIAAAESVYLVYAAYLGFKGRRGRLVREIRFLLVNVLLIAGVLMVAAVFEVSEIQIASASPGGQATALVTWLPFAAVLAGALFFWRSARRDAPELEARDAPETAPNEGAPQVVGDQGLPQSEKDAAGSPTSSPLRDESGATA
jgi:uncharacterized membrane protein SpoIIM required for sporulation